MKINRKIRFLLVILSALVISSCSCKNKSNNFTEIAKENDIVHFLAVDLQGNLIGVDTDGKQIQPCIPQNTKTSYGNTHSGSEPCQTQIVDKGGKTIVIKNEKQITPIFDSNIRVTGFKGSHCQTSTGGNQIESCAPF